MHTNRVLLSNFQTFIESKLNNGFGINKFGAYGLRFTEFRVGLDGLLRRKLLAMTVDLSGNYCFIVTLVRDFAMTIVNTHILCHG